MTENEAEAARTPVTSDKFRQREVRDRFVLDEAVPGELWEARGIDLNRLRQEREARVAHDSDERAHD